MNLTQSHQVYCYNESVYVTILRGTKDDVKQT